MGMLPGMGNLKALAENKPDEKQIARIEAIISSMTPDERRKQHIINGSRRKRIAKGSGTSVEEVNRLLKQFVQMQKMLKSLGGMAGLAGGGKKARRSGHADAAQPRVAAVLEARSDAASSEAATRGALAQRNRRSGSSPGAPFRRVRWSPFVCVAPVPRSVRSSASSSPIPAPPATAAFVEILGHYNPRTKPALVDIQQERVDYWISKGAQPSDSVRTLIARHLTPVAAAAPRRRRPRPSERRRGGGHRRARGRRGAGEGAGRLARRGARDRDAAPAGRRSSSCTCRRGDLGQGDRPIRDGRRRRCGRWRRRAGEQDGKTVTLEIRETPLEGRESTSWRTRTSRTGTRWRWSGAIARAHGIRGQVIVNPETDFPDERFQPGAELFIERGGTRRSADGDHARGFSASGRSSASRASRR